jgi:hypothetical protein
MGTCLLRYKYTLTHLFKGLWASSRCWCCLHLPRLQSIKYRSIWQKVALTWIQTTDPPLFRQVWKQLCTLDLIVTNIVNGLLLKDSLTRCVCIPVFQWFGSDKVWIVDLSDTDNQFLQTLFPAWPIMTVHMDVHVILDSLTEVWTISVNFWMKDEQNI